MPREQKHSRGRRDKDNLKRKREEAENPPSQNSKKICDNHENGSLENYIALDVHDPQDEEINDSPFFGLLLDEEQDYFRRSDELLELNDFPDEEQRSLFIANVLREAENKELKIACSQSCSRLMERLILLCSTEQKKKLFEKFAGSFLHLIQHRFASHCCEMLFVQSAPVVTEELKTKSYSGQDIENNFPSMETLFLQTLDEFEGKMSTLLTDRFASHTLRVLLVILDGRSPSELTNRTLLQSKRKEKITIASLDTNPSPSLNKKRPVPSSFAYAVQKIISDLAISMDPPFIRLLATHPTGNPTLQLLLELELTNPNFKEKSKTGEKTIMSSILSDAIDAENSESLVLINGILYDSIGSRLLETICSFAPAKLFKQIYQFVFKDRIAAIVRNEISSYTAIRALTRISKQDLEEALTTILPQIPGLIERNRTLVIRILVERCHARGADTAKLISTISSAYGGHPETLLLKMTCLDITTLISTTKSGHGAGSEQDPKTIQNPKLMSAQLHGSLLAQSLLMLSGPPSELIQTTLLSLPPQILLALALYTTTSHIIQTALSPLLPVLFRRKLINSLLFSSPELSADEQNPVIALALSSAGSHVLDALFTCTVSSGPTLPGANMANSTPLFTFAERISLILVSREHEIRNSFFGRLVWRNWSLELFKRSRSEWVHLVKNTPAPQAMTVTESIHGITANTAVTTKANTNETKKSASTLNDPKSNGINKMKNRKIKGFKSEAQEAGGKSPIQLARERYATGKGTGVNAKKLGSRLMSTLS
ncbi:Nucleolar protein 9 [Golovinomyces cichoracearum]|uniref:Nucleolar protein 9 n=1 Tax=Golovinomyces cichoracearum TaxID=62708 RepID=A0A420IX14_9PEZI|nr:Nucleolar protein 9 [Golovinomyces cichoracearum]